MDPSVEKYVDRLLTQEALEQPSDDVKPEELVMELPPWYDDELFKTGRRFYHEHSFTLTGSMLFGLVAVFAVPSILKVLISTRRSNSIFTAYRRYLSTILHTVSWFEHDLKPGTMSWRSLETVRTRHIRATQSSKLKGVGQVSQRDLALTMFGFIGFSMLKPDAFGIRQSNERDWEGYNHFWRVISHMIGMKEEYSLAQKSVEETRQACQLLQERVFTPCLENVPEYFEHSARVMLDGLWSINPTIDVDANLWWCRYLADVPGYIYSENDRIQLQRRIKKQLGGNSLDTERVFTPCLENVPEYFEHSARVMLDGLWSINPTIDVDANLWWCHYLADVPGYIYSENDRIQLQRRIKQQLGGNSLDTGVEITKFIQSPAVAGLPDLSPRKLYYKDYNSVESSPEYKQLNFKSKTKLYLNYLYVSLYTCCLGRWYFNVNFKFSLFLMRYFPYVAFFRFGIKSSMVNVFVEDVKDDTKVKPNSDYKKHEETPWYEKIFILFW